MTISNNKIILIIFNIIKYKIRLISFHSKLDPLLWIYQNADPFVLFFQTFKKTFKHLNLFVCI